MAEKFAKWVGGAIGWALGGPIGGMVGFSLGFLWDNATLKGGAQRPGSGYSQSTRQGDFTISLLVLSAAVMKADNRVLKSELNYVKTFLVRQFGEVQAKELLRVLKDLLDQNVALGPVCTQIRAHMTHAQRLELMHFLLGIANADGVLHAAELRTIQTIGRYLNVSVKDIDSMEAMFEQTDDRYYRILELEKGASQEEIKKAYRKMAKKYHPDKLGDVGEEVRASAIEKFRMVQEAYDKLSTKK